MAESFERRGGGDRLIANRHVRQHRDLDLPAAKWRETRAVDRSDPIELQQALRSTAVEMSMFISPTSQSVNNSTPHASEFSEVPDATGELGFFDLLARSTQPLADPDQVMQVSARLLGQHLAANRCAYAEVDPDEDHFTLTGDYSQGVSSIVGRYSFSQFGAECLRLMRANEPYVIHDVDTDPRTAGTELGAYRLTQIQAVICIPLHKDGRFVAAMAVHQRTPRRWTSKELELVQLVCSRCWESLQRTRTQHALEVTNERLSIALSAGLLGDWSWNAESDLVTLSDRAAELFGLVDKQIPWRTLAAYIHDEDRERTMQAVAESTRTGGPYKEEYRLAAFPERWISVWGTPQKDDSAKVTGILGVLQDSTAAKRMEQDLRRHALQLQEADHRKDEFLAVLAHELRNPLAPIGLAAQLLKRSSDTGTQRTADLIRSQVNQMSRLLEDLLDTSRIKSGKLNMKKEVVEARATVDLALQNAGPILTNRKHTTLVHVEDNLTLNADPVRMAQVLSNLLTNAAKYTPVNGCISVRAAASEGYCQFEVSDNGIGLAHDSLERIFEMFSQEDSVLHRPEGGLGIGLALARAIVAAHGGTVAADSEGLGKGSRFVVRLPMEAALRQTGSPAASDTPRERTLLSIVVADDNTSAVQLLAELLRMEGHQVSIATDGEQAFAVAQAVKPAVLILDIGMPKMTGYEVAEAVRKTNWGRHAFLVAATGWGQASDKARARQAGFDAHLTKPFDPEELLRLLERCPPLQR
ncbi:hybrid sensor histidine kinase/response regulator [Variovorax paradoxus]|uniref:hybrid sensor histidine kinase/response regulator n=1 Tax=Variovorax paradoxus TaxID=34073 RepID=UPI00155DCA82|nr:ATP-binding protein [Variovorax paradoxus]